MMESHIEKKHLKTAANVSSGLLWIEIVEHNG